MAYFAQIDENGVVLQVISINDNEAPNPAPEHSEPLGQQFIASIGLPGNWRQTSFNHRFRKQYAGIGYTYDEANDVFVAPQPFASWSLDSNHDWQPPVPKPAQGDWYWNEDDLNWVEIE